MNKDILLDQETHKFHNVKDKIRNKKLNDETAWEVAQPLLKYCIEDYPEKYHPYLGLIKDVFCLRRGTFLQKIQPSLASKEIKKLVGSLNDEDQNTITDLIVCIRDFFESTGSHFRQFKSS